MTAQATRAPRSDHLEILFRQALDFPIPEPVGDEGPQARPLWIPGGAINRSTGGALIDQVSPELRDLPRPDCFDPSIQLSLLSVVGPEFLAYLQILDWCCELYRTERGAIVERDSARLFDLQRGHDAAARPRHLPSQKGVALKGVESCLRV